MTAIEPLKIELSDDVTKVFQKLTDDLLAAKEALSEERIRAIVREELTAWEKRQRQTRGWTTMEIK